MLSRCRGRCRSVKAAVEVLRLKREKDEVRLESMLIARDLRIGGCWQVREIGLRSQRVLGGTFSFFVF
jgi:hypothetical protein